MEYDWNNRRNIDNIGIFAAGYQSFADKRYESHFVGDVSHVGDRYLLMDGSWIHNRGHGAFHRKRRHFLLGLDHFDRQIEV
jgi:hypothetical protein